MKLNISKKDNEIVQTGSSETSALKKTEKKEVVIDSTKVLGHKKTQRN